MEKEFKTFTVSVHERYRDEIFQIRNRESEVRNFSEFVCEAILFYDKYRKIIEEQFSREDVIRQFLMKQAIHLSPSVEYVVDSQQSKHKTQEIEEVSPNDSETDLAETEKKIMFDSVSQERENGEETHIDQEVNIKEAKEVTEVTKDEVVGGQEENNGLDSQDKKNHRVNKLAKSLFF